MGRQLLHCVLASSSIYVALSVLCPRCLPGHLRLIDELCPPTWHFYTPHETTTGGCGIPEALEPWLSPTLAWIEGSILGVVAYTATRTLAAIRR